MGVVDRLAAGPLLENDAAAGQRAPDAFVVLYSGDGGWAQADCNFSRLFAQRGQPVLGVNSVRYFASRRSPAAAGADLSRWIETYSARWGRPKVILMGYSFGASTLPIIAQGLTPARQGRGSAKVALAGPAGSSSNWSCRPRKNWFNRPGHPDATPCRWQPAIARFRDLHVLCVYGAEDAHAVCPQTPSPGRTPS